MNDKYDLANILSCSVFTRANRKVVLRPKLYVFVRWHGVFAWNIALATTVFNNQPAALQRVLLFCMLLNSLQDMFSHHHFQIRNIEMAGKPPNGNSLSLPQRNWQALTVPPHSSSAGLSTAFPFLSKYFEPVYPQLAVLYSPFMHQVQRLVICRL